MPQPELDRIKEVFPHLANDEEVVSLAEHRDRLRAVAATMTNDGGKAILALVSDAAEAALGALRAGYQEMSRDQLVSYLAAWKANGDIAEQLLGADAAFKQSDEELMEAVARKGGAPRDRE